MPFIEMDPELALKAIEGYENELAPEAAKLEAFYRQFNCKRCGSSALNKEVDVRHAFADEDTLVPRSLLRCAVCGFLFDPHSGLTLEIGRDFVPILDPTVK
jgi:ribosomal protein L37E